MNQTIEIVVGSTGQTRVETKGFHGADCQAASRFIELALGQKIDEVLTVDFYQIAASQQQVRQGG